MLIYIGMFAYLINENELKKENPGIWEKAAKALGGGVKGRVRKVSKLFGEDMSRLGLLFSVSLPFKTENLLKLCEKEGVNILACGKLPSPDKEELPENIVIADGFPVRFEKLIGEICSLDEVRESRVCAVISEDTPFEYISRLSDTLRFMSLAGCSKAAMEEKAERLYSRNGLCVTLALSPGQVQKNEAAVLLDARSASSLKAALPRIRFDVNDEKYEETLEVFGGKLGMITLNSSGVQALSLDISSGQLYNR